MTLNHLRSGILCTLVAGLGLALPLSGAASAQPAPVAIKMYTPMVSARIEAVVPDGSQIDITLAGGQTIHAPVSLYKQVDAAMLAGEKSLYTSLPGPCGESWVTIGYQNTAFKPYLMSTGFSLSGGKRAVSYDWWVQIDGPDGYNYSWQDGGALGLDTSWQGGYSATGPLGRWSATVDTLSWAVTDTGLVCESAGPSDSATL